MIVKLYGVCEKIDDNYVYVANKGIVKVNVEGLVTVGDKITVGKTAGKGVAIKYLQDETQFDIRGIGKVVEIFNDYKTVKVMLNIE